MMTHRLGRPLLLISTLLIFGAAQPAAQSPGALTGVWVGTATLASPSSSLRNVEVVLYIEPGGSVTGMVGDMMLRDARVTPSRGYFWWFRPSTEWRIAGDFADCVVAGDGQQTRAVFSLAWQRDHFDGRLVLTTTTPEGRSRAAATPEPLRLDRLR